MQFVNIDTGNAEETADQTKVEFLPQAETLAKTEVENKLKELYQLVTVLPQTASSSYDITITIGGE